MPDPAPRVKADRVPGILCAAKYRPIPADSHATQEALDCRLPDTRARIVEAALALFNADGSHAVSTRHIAAPLGISPGNLYYHFANKEEIVLCLYERIEAQLGRSSRRARGEAHVRHRAAVPGRHLRPPVGIPFLLPRLEFAAAGVPGLKERYRALAERVRIRARDLRLDGGCRLDGRHPDQLELLTTNAWIVLTQWFTHRQVVERRRTIQSSDIHEGIRHFVALFSPLLRSPQRKLVERMTARPTD